MEKGTLLRCTVLYCIVLHCTVLYWSTVLYCIKLYIVLCWIVLYWVALCCIVLYGMGLSCIVFIVYVYGVASWQLHHKLVEPCWRICFTDQNGSKWALNLDLVGRKPSSYPKVCPQKTILELEGYNFKTFIVPVSGAHMFRQNTITTLQQNPDQSQAAERKGFWQVPAPSSLRTLWV